MKMKIYLLQQLHDSFLLRGTTFSADGQRCYSSVHVNAASLVSRQDRGAFQRFFEKHFRSVREPVLVAKTTRLIEISLPLNMCAEKPPNLRLYSDQHVVKERHL